MPKAVRKKKKFINKKEATTYRLIPGYVEDDAEENLSKEEIEGRKEEQRKYGIFFDDTYNYMKHLRSLTEQATLVNNEEFSLIPDDQSQCNSSSAPSVFKEFLSTDVTEEEELDPDILEALDNAPVVKFDEADAIENEDFLEDDFLVKAGGVVHEEVEESDSERSCDENDFDSFDDESDGDESLEESTQTRDRGTVQDEIVEAQTALILKNFEEGLGFQCSTQFSDDETDNVTAEDYENLKEILKHDKTTDKQISWQEVFNSKDERPKIDTSRYLYEDVDEFEWKEVPASKKFDCVSILSLNSNTRNLPTDLIPPKLKTNKANSVSESETSKHPGLSLKELEKELRQARSIDKASTYRPRDETTEEKKARKKALKEERKERRQEKKANKEVFALENEKLKKETAALHKAVKTVTIC